MIINKTLASKTASHLLDIKAIKLQPSKPFKWASGWNSPIYCDNRIALSHPKVRNFIKKSMAEFIKEKYPNAELIAGVATGAIGIGALVADQLNLPFVYVRPEAKSHGRKNLIEGQYSITQKTVVIEDLISTGGSSLKAVSSLRSEGINVLGMVAIFTYGFDKAKKSFEEEQMALHTLSDYDHLVLQAKESEYIKASEMETLSEWRRDPASWNAI